MTRKLISIFASLMLVLSGALVSAPTVRAQQGPARVGGSVYYSTAYNQWTSTVSQGFTGTGSQTMLMLYGYVTLPDGRPFVPFNTNVPLQVDVGANAEVVTPSAVSGCAPLNPNQGVCAITATFSNAHGNGTLVSSGDFGIEEAILDAGNNGGGNVYWSVSTGIVTLNTGGLTTTTTVKVPSTFYNQGASARVTTTITGASTIAVGVSGATGIFCASTTPLTAGSTCVQVAPGLTGTGSTALTAILLTATVANATAGAMKVVAWGYTPVSANS